MPLTKIAAFVVGALALICAGIAISAFTSGERGYMVLIGLIAAGGSVLLAMKAAVLFAQEPARKRPPLRFTPGQRLGMLAIGVLAMGFGINDLVTGRSDPVKGSAVTREKQPGQFWQAVALHFGTGGVLFYFALRKPPPLRPAATSKGRDTDRKGADRRGGA